MPVCGTDATFTAEGFVKFGPFRFQKVDHFTYLGSVVSTGNSVFLKMNRKIINANRSYLRFESTSPVSLSTNQNKDAAL